MLPSREAQHAQPPARLAQGRLTRHSDSGAPVVALGCVRRRRLSTSCRAGAMPVSSAPSRRHATRSVQQQVVCWRCRWPGCRWPLRSHLGSKLALERLHEARAVVLVVRISPQPGHLLQFNRLHRPHQDGCCCCCCCCWGRLLRLVRRRGCDGGFGAGGAAAGVCPPPTCWLCWLLLPLEPRLAHGPAAGVAAAGPPGRLGARAPAGGGPLRCRLRSATRARDRVEAPPVGPDGAPPPSSTQMSTHSAVYRRQHLQPARLQRVAPAAEVARQRKMAGQSTRGRPGRSTTNTRNGSARAHRAFNGGWQVAVRGPEWAVVARVDLIIVSRLCVARLQPARRRCEVPRPRPTDPRALARPAAGALTSDRSSTRGMASLATATMVRQRGVRFRLGLREGGGAARTAQGHAQAVACPPAGDHPPPVAAAAAGGQQRGTDERIASLAQGPIGYDRVMAILRDSNKGSTLSSEWQRGSAEDWPGAKIEEGKLVELWVACSRAGQRPMIPMARSACPTPPRSACRAAGSAGSTAGPARQPGTCRCLHTPHDPA